uniref:Uncharacterized protein n=1 Tax=Desulfomonile tiedjei TaxID=2358 RepID=A0A7C4ASM6_9BACT
MSVVSLGPGDDVDAWCTRCRMNLNHRVIAMVGNTIQTVLCLTCQSTHRYHPPRKGKPGADADEYDDVTIRASSRAKTMDRIAVKRADEWATFMKAMPEGAQFKQYNPSGNFTIDDYVEHPAFGRGKVIEIVGQGKILVIFEAGRKILVCNRPVAASSS